jgi:transposase
LLARSPYDGEARYGIKRTTTWTGYKVHLTETCEEDHPKEVTNVVTTVATVPDTELLDPIHAHVAERDLLPATHLVDAGYVDAGIGVPEALVHHVEVIGPGRRRHQLAGEAGAGIG